MFKKIFFFGLIFVCFFIPNLSLKVQASGGLPDLIIESLTIKKWELNPDTLVVNYTFKNKGLGDANGPSWMRYYTDNNTDNKGGGLWLFSGQSLNSGESKSGEFQIATVGGLSFDTFTLVVDSNSYGNLGGEIDESYENNNTKTTTLTIQATGSLSVTNYIAFATPKTYQAGTTNVRVASFVFTASTGSDMKLKQIDTVANFNSGVNINDTLQNIKLFVDNTQIGEGVLALSSSARNQGITFNNLSYTIPKGTNKILDIHADIKGSAPNNKMFYIYISGAGDIIAQDESGGGTITGKFPVKGPEITVSNPISGELSVANNSAFASPITYKAGTTNVRVASFVFTASTGSDVQLVHIGASTNLESGDSIYETLENIKLMDGETKIISGTPSLSSNRDINFDHSYYTIPKGTTKILDIYADIKSDAPDNKKFYIFLTDIIIKDESGGGGTITGSFPVNGPEITISNPNLVSTKKPDLTFISLTLSPSAPKIGEAILIRAYRQNIGKAEAPFGSSINCRITKKSDGSIFSDDTFPEQASLGIIGSQVFAHQTKAFTEEGDYLVTLTVDSQNTIDESNENNNTYTQTITVTGEPVTPSPVTTEKPDLIITDAKGITKDKIVNNEKYKVVIFNIDFKNQGTKEITSPFYISILGNKPNNDQYVEQIRVDASSIDPVKINKTYQVSISDNYLIPIGSSIKKNFGFYIDMDLVTYTNYDVIEESNENNNTFEQVIYAVGPLSDTPTPTPTPSTPEPTPTPTPSTPTPTPTEPTPTGTVEPSKVERLILKLERTISALEQQIVEIEKRLVKVVDRALTHRVKGRILLQVEEHGEAWYVDPESENKLYMRDGQAAYDIMRALGLGITNTNLEKIPIGIQERLFELKDTDNDGIPDKVEEAIGTDKNQADSDRDGYNDKTEILNSYRPDREGKFIYDSNLANRLVGRILLQVESHGEAWYIHPSDNKRYYLGDPGTAYNVMRFLSLGITNNDLRKIQVGEFE